MKLLFDENLSPKLMGHLKARFPGSQHVETTGLRGRPDQDLWEYAKENDFTIVSKDNDFRQRAFLHGPPPKIIWLAVGNLGTLPIAQLLMDQTEAIYEFGSHPEEALYVLVV